VKKTFIWEPAARADLRRLDRDTAMRILTSLTRYGETGEGDAKLLTDRDSESKTETVLKALKERLEAVRRQQRKRHILERLDEIAIHCASLPVLDSRSPENMLYDERGLPR